MSASAVNTAFASSPETSVEAALGELGFTEKETRIYLALADLGRATAQVIARRCGLARTTVYFVIDSLAQRGFVIAERKKNTTYYSPSTPAALLRFAKEQHQRSQDQVNVAETLQRILTPYFNAKLFSVPTMQFFEGRESVERMLYDFLPEWMESMKATDNTWWGYQDNEFVTEYLEYLRSYWRIKPVDQRVYLFSNAEGTAFESKVKVPNRIIRPLPKGYTVRSVIWLCGDYLIVIMHQNRPPYAFQIRDPLLTANLKVFFEMLWGTTK